ncbi:MAG: FcoT family thioesterase, partial [Cyanobacteria bacterium J06635_10]
MYRFLNSNLSLPPTTDFSIPESCYIDDTGHFNSVEFNICYNQLFYIIIAYLIKNQLLEVMKDWNLE